MPPVDKKPPFVKSAPLSRRNSTGGMGVSLPPAANINFRAPGQTRPIVTDETRHADGIDRDTTSNSRTHRLEGTQKSSSEMHEALTDLKLDKRMKRAFIAKKAAPVVMALTGFISLILLFAAPHLAVVPGLLLMLSVGAETIAASYIRRRTKEIAPKFIRDFEMSKESLKKEQAEILAKQATGALGEEDTVALKNITEVLEHGDFLTNDLAMPFTFKGFLSAKEAAMSILQKARAPKADETPKGA